MEIKGNVHCFFEQSGTFKNEFIKLGYKAFDYDIQDKFGETDHNCNLFDEIENAYEDKPSIFDNISTDDIIIAFFPCIHFCDAKTMSFKCVNIGQKTWSLQKKMTSNIHNENQRHYFFVVLMKLVAVCDSRKIRLVIENPWNTSGMTYLQNNFINPTIIDKNRTLRGDYFVKPTAYWFFGCEPTQGTSVQRNSKPLIVCDQRGSKRKAGVCDEKRSMISPDYARNFICDFIIGKEQKQYSIGTLF